MDTSKPGLQSSKLDKALNTIGRTKFRMVMVSEGAKLSNVCKKGFTFAAACWNVWMKRKKIQLAVFNLTFKRRMTVSTTITTLQSFFLKVSSVLPLSSVVR